MSRIFVALSILLCISCAHRPVESFKPSESYQAARPRSKKLPIVMIDPGHGGDSFGTQTVTLPHIQEKTLALQCALKVAKYLEDWGYEVRMTRRKDEAVSLAKRVQMARGSALFVSVHFNHAPNPDANGVEIFYYNSTNDLGRQEHSKRLAKDILRFIVRETDCFSRGVHAGNFHVIRENTIPAVLVEGGFCSNVTEARKLSDQKYISKLAYAIARGIDNYSN